MKTDSKLLNEIRQYIADNYEPEVCSIFDSKCRNKAKEDEFVFSMDLMMAPSVSEEVKDDLDLDFSMTWQKSLFIYIDDKKLKDTDLYKKSFISKQTFSKIRSDINYKPDKETAIKLSLGLELDLTETDEFLKLAGYALSPAIERDLVVKYFIDHKDYNILHVNDALYDLELKILPIPLQ